MPGRWDVERNIRLPKRDKRLQTLELSMRDNSHFYPTTNEEPDKPSCAKFYPRSRNISMSIYLVFDQGGGRDEEPNILAYTSMVFPHIPAR